MRTQTDTDIEINYLVSCEICGNWFWSKQRSMFICDDCKEIERKRYIEKQRQKVMKNYKIAERSMQQGAGLFGIVVENKLHGIKSNQLRSIALGRGIITKNLHELVLTMERTGHLVWLDEWSNLRPYKNINTGEIYE